MTNNSGKLSFVVYETFNDSIKFLPDNLRLRMYDLIFQYGLYEQIPEDVGDVEMALLSPIIFGIVQAKKRRTINQENGSKAGNRKGNQNARKDKKMYCVYSL